MILKAFSNLKISVSLSERAAEICNTLEDLYSIEQYSLIISTYFSVF